MEFIAITKKKQRQRKDIDPSLKEMSINLQQNKLLTRFSFGLLFKYNILSSSQVHKNIHNIAFPCSSLRFD